MKITNMQYIEKAQRPKINSKQHHNHEVKPNITVTGDSYTCQNTAEMRQKLQCAKEHGICGNLQYIPEKKFLFIYTKKAQYAYTCNGNETPKTIREMFGLKNGALRRCDSYIFDVDRAYPKNQVVYFYEEDIKK